MSEQDVTLNEVYESSADLLNRFGVDPKTDEAWRVFAEEVQEVKEAMTAAMLTDTPQTARRHIAEELMDVLVSGINLARSAGVTSQMINDAAHQVMSKNDAKTHDTHKLNGDGKIARKA